ncbi:Hypothetical predicted protein, partial [Mytilus galloprovincialis]
MSKLGMVSESGIFRSGRSPEPSPDYSGVRELGFRHRSGIFRSGPDKSGVRESGFTWVRNIPEWSGPFRSGGTGMQAEGIGIQAEGGSLHVFFSFCITFLAKFECIMKKCSTIVYCNFVVPYVPAFVSRLQRRTVESSPSGDSSSPSTDVLGSRYYTKYLGLGRRKKELSLPDTDVHGLMDNSELSKIKEDSIASSPDSPGLYNFDFEDNSEFSKRREDSSASYSYKQDLPSKQKIKETQKNPWSK